MRIENLDDSFSNIKSCYNNSIILINNIKEASKPFEDDNFCLLINGSLARKEVSKYSDFDAVLVGRDLQGSIANRPKELWKAGQEAAGLKDPGSTGTFGVDSYLLFDSIVENIGGHNDDNKKITQRMLIILESIPFGNTKIYDSLLDSILLRYISDSITNHQLGLFLLNDIIRYYRTICVDFEFKTHEEGKDWGLRNIKLVYSRKIIYFAGLLMCAELAQRS